MWLFGEGGRLLDCRAWIDVSVSFNGALSITASIFCRMMTGWSSLMERGVVTHFSVLCWRTGKNCVKSESGYFMSRGAYVRGCLCLGSLCRIHSLPWTVSANVCSSVPLHTVRLCPEQSLSVTFHVRTVCPHVDTSRPKFESACPRQTHHHFLSLCVSNRTLIGRLLCDTNFGFHFSVDLHDDILVHQEN